MEITKKRLHDEGNSCSRQLTSLEVTVEDEELGDMQRRSAAGSRAMMCTILAQQCFFAKIGLTNIDLEGKEAGVWWMSN